MAPTNKNIRTYDKKGRKSVDVLNTLLAQNLTKRLIGKKKSKVKLKELPPKALTTEVFLSDESSLKVNKSDTFDKLLNGKVFNPVKVVKKFVKIESSESDVSRSHQLPQVSVSYHSPIMTRKRAKQSSVVISEINNKSSPLSATKSSTTFESLQIEKENKKLNFSSLSYIQLPKIKENQVMTTSEHNTRMEASYEPLFSDTFRERHTVHSSTPCVINQPPKIVVDSISPITAPIPNPKLMKKSYDEIKRWDSSYPSMDQQKTPPGPVLRSSVKKNDAGKIRRRKLSTVMNASSSEPKRKFDDWKLNCQPKVYVQKGDLIDFFEEAGEEKGESGFKGFTDLEQSESWEMVKSMETEKEEVNVKKKINESRRRKKSIKTSRDVTPRLTRSAKMVRKLDEWKLNCQPKVYLQKDDLIDSFEEADEGRREIGFKGFTDLERSHSWEKVKRREGEKKEKEKVKVKKKINDSRKRKKSIKTSRDVTPRMTRSSKMVTRTSSKKLLNKSTKEQSISKYSCVTLRRPKFSFKGTLKRSKKNSKLNQSIRSSSSKNNKPSVNCCEDLSRDLEINLPEYVITKFSNVTTTSSTKNVLSVDEKQFETFANSCSYLMDNTDVNTTQSEIKDGIISTISSNDESKVFTNKNLPDDNDKQLSPNVDTEKNLSSPRKTPMNSSPRTRKNIFPSPKEKREIVILSDITLGTASSPKIHEMLKTYQNVWHDHSYSYSPKPRQLTFIESSPPPSRKTKEKPNESTLQLSDIIETSVSSNNRVSLPKCSPVDIKRRKSITLKPGKSYRRSLSLLKRSLIMVNALNAKQCHDDCDCFECLCQKKLNETRPRKASVIVPATIEESPRKNKSILEIYARRHSSYEQKSQIIGGLGESVRNLSLISTRSSLIQQHEDDNLALVTAKDLVLRRCGQTEVLPFEQCYPRSALQHCQKIGEGVYGEVFLYRNQAGGTSVMKIIPIEGDLIVNGEKQKKYDEIITEITISMELSNLRNNKKNCTSGFSELKAVRCIQGCYPENLLDLWQLYDENHGSENDSPQIFPPDQQYIVLELANGGQDVESYVFNSALQVFSMFKQTACALAIAESQLKFEHRDLHWGNILITTVDKNKNLQFRLNGKEIEIASHGVEVSIIDFTLSRVECDGVVIFNDLSLDNDLFVAKGDYQFEIYRLMQKSNGNNWKTFNPYTNILWLHYLLDKAVTSTLRYKNTRSKIHKEYLAKLKKLQDNILTFQSAVDFVVNNFI